MKKILSTLLASLLAISVSAFAEPPANKTKGGKAASAVETPAIEATASDTKVKGAKGSKTARNTEEQSIETDESAKKGKTRKSAADAETPALEATTDNSKAKKAKHKKRTKKDNENRATPANPASEGNPATPAVPASKAVPATPAVPASPAN